MNTQPKSVEYKVCKECGQTYGIAGNMPFRLAQTRYASNPVLGICPSHKKPAEAGK